MYYYELNEKYYETREEALKAAREDIELEDLVEYVSNGEIECTIKDMLGELEDYYSPLYQEILQKGLDIFFADYFSEV